MISTATPKIEGRPIKEYPGVITSQTITGANFIKDIIGGTRDISGRSGAYEKVIQEAKPMG